MDDTEGETTTIYTGVFTYVAVIALLSVSCDYRRQKIREVTALEHVKAEMEAERSTTVTEDGDK